ncbi:MAG: hypothetical protein CUN55_14500 [Phototrophicales bacterium]|nr:MAG: hypothetical protein CUN55_14500 [Phototrophicales bacterium]
MQNKVETFFQQMYQFTSLARPIDPKTPSNLIAVLTASIVFIGAAILQLSDGEAVLASLSNAFLGAVTVFVAWVIAREIDPDHQGSSLWTLAIAIVIYALLGESALFSVVGLVIASRFLNRSVGPPPKIGDAIALIGIVGLAVGIHGHWVLGVLIFVALMFENTLPMSDRKSYLYAIGVALVTILAIYFTDNPVFDWTLDVPAIAIALLTGVAFVFYLLRQPHHLQSSCDDGSRLIEWRRVFAAELLVLMAALSLLIVEGANGVAALGSAWAALGGVGWYAIYRYFSGQKEQQPSQNSAQQAIN